MADDMEIIKQIGKQLGIELKRLPLEKIMGPENGIAVDHTGQVKGLNLYGRNIRDYSFLNSLGGLTHISLRLNQITDLTPLSALTKLETLYLNKNQITDLTPLSNLTNLTVLSLDKNQITDLTVIYKIKTL